MCQIDPSIDLFVLRAGRMPRNILRLWGFLCVRDARRRTQSYQNHWRSIASVQLQLLDFLYIVHSKERAISPHLCAEPVGYIKKIKITNERTTHYAIKILITKFCYGKGIEGKMCL